MAQEDIILTTAVTVANKKYTTDEEELIHQFGKPNAKVEVLLPEDMDPQKFDTALSAVSKSLARIKLQGEMMFTVLGRLLQVAQKNPELWNKKYERFEDFRLSLAERFGLSRQTSYDALEYANRWAGVLPPSEFKTVGRVKLKILSRNIGKGDEGKATARKLLEFAKNNTADALDEQMDKVLHIGRGASVGAYLKIPCNKSQLKLFDAWFSDPRVQATCESENASDILVKMIAECKAEWEKDGQDIIDAKAQAEADKGKASDPAA